MEAIIRRGDMPKPIKLSYRLAMFRLADVEALEAKWAAASAKRVA